MTLCDIFRNKTVSLLGAGVSNMPLAAFLSEQGAKLTVRDMKSAQELGERAAELNRARKTKEWVQSGAIGQIRQVNCDYSFPMIKLPIQKPRHTSPEMIGGALLDIGVYCVRYCYELFGFPKEILCNGRVVNGIDLGEHITLRYDGFDCNLRISRDELDGEKLTILGQQGSIYLPIFHATKKAMLKTTKRELFRDKSLLFGTQFSAVAAEIRSGAKEGIAIPSKSTVDVLKILDICRNQMGLVYPCEKE